MPRGTNKKHERRIDEIAQEVAEIKNALSEDWIYRNKKMDINIGRNVEYLPSPFEIAKYYGIRWEYIEIDGDEPSYFERKKLTIYISDRYCNDDYAARHLCAHELGHFFLHNKPVSAMNPYLRKTEEEYEANIFSIFLMPQIMAGYPWENLSPKELNEMIYKKVFKKSK